jgi:hypothetical protein
MAYCALFVHNKVSLAVEVIYLTRSDASAVPTIQCHP